MDQLDVQERPFIDHDAFGNRNHPMNIAFMSANSFQEVLEKLEPGEEEVVDFMKTINPALYNKDTELGTKLRGDELLVQRGFAEITGNDPDLTLLVGLFVAGDALEEADDSLIGDSRLLLKQLHGGGQLIKDVYDEIIKSNTILPNKAQQEKFNKSLKSTVELYREQGILHASEDAVKAAIK